LNVTDAIKTRRAYRSLELVEITRELVEDLATHASLSASCFNNQPWRYVFVYDKKVLEEVWGALSRSNKWVQLASMIIAVFSKPDDDCQIRTREYHQFDLGMATAFLILRAHELGLVAHPIAGFKPKQVREILGIPDGYQLLTLVNVGKKTEEIHPYLTEDQAEREKERPERYQLEKFAYHNRYTGEA
jgi:nitroreductase